VSEDEEVVYGYSWVEGSTYSATLSL